MAYQDDFDRQALIEELGQQKAGGQPPGIQAPVDPQQPIEGPMSPTSQPAPADFSSKLEGFGGTLEDGRSKLSAGDSPKYQAARVFQKYDPKGGITQPMLDELQALGLGDVTGKVGGDKIGFGGKVDPRFNGVTEFDVIRNLEEGGGWQWGGLNGGAEQGPEMQAQPPGLIDQGALDPQNGQGGEFFQRLLAQLQEQAGPESTDKEALMRMMGA